MHRVILPAADLLPNPQLRPFRCVQSRAVLRLASAAADRGKAKENGRLAEVEPRRYEYICTPTGDELPDMLAHWGRLESILGQPIIRLDSG